jgi:hypothetical protein
LEKSSKGGEEEDIIGTSGTRIDLKTVKMKKDNNVKRKKKITF